MLPTFLFFLFNQHQWFLKHPSFTLLQLLFLLFQLTNQGPCLSSCFFLIYHLIFKIWVVPFRLVFINEGNFLIEFAKLTKDILLLCLDLVQPRVTFGDRASIYISLFSPILDHDDLRAVSPLRVIDLVDPWNNLILCYPRIHLQLSLSICFLLFLMFAITTIKSRCAFNACFCSISLIHLTLLLFFQLLSASICHLPLFRRGLLSTIIDFIHNLFAIIFIRVGDWEVFKFNKGFHSWSVIIFCMKSKRK